jgi:enoyl-CoA hydratase/carnithine racemase
VWVNRDESVRVIVLKAAGDNFCGGHDIRQMSEHSQHSDTPYFEVRARQDADQGISVLPHEEEELRICPH